MQRCISGTFLEAISIILQKKFHKVYVSDENDHSISRGKLRIVEVVKGSVRVLGSTLGPGTPPRNVFSPRGYSLLNLAFSSAGSPRHTDSDIKSRLANLGLEDVDAASSGLCVQLSGLFF